MEPDDRALDIWTARVNEIYLAAAETGFLIPRDEPRQPRLVDDNVVEIYLELAFGRDDTGKPLIPMRRGEREPWIIIEEWIGVQPSAVLQGYNYDLVDGAGGQHYGIHFHGHGGQAYPHHQGMGVPGGHDKYPFVDVSTALWELLKAAFGNRLGRT